MFHRAGCGSCVAGEMRAEFAHVVLGTVHEARLPAAKIGQPQHIQSRRVNDAAIVRQFALAVEDRRRCRCGITVRPGGRPMVSVRDQLALRNERRNDVAIVSDDGEIQSREHDFLIDHPGRTG